MAVPKRRTSRSKRNQRRANHDRVAAPAINRCANCGEIKVPHRVCLHCGHYDGKPVIEQAAPSETNG